MGEMQDGFACKFIANASTSDKELLEELVKVNGSASLAPGRAWCSTWFGCGAFPLIVLCFNQLSSVCRCEKMATQQKAGAESASPALMSLLIDSMKS